jgi:hypothetical protein
VVKNCNKGSHFGQFFHFILYFCAFIFDFYNKKAPSEDRAFSIKKQLSLSAIRLAELATHGQIPPNDSESPKNQNPAIPSTLDPFLPSPFSILNSPT